MSMEALAACQRKMRDAQVPEAAIAVFTHYYQQVEQGASGLIREDTVAPLLDPPMLDDVRIDADAAREAIGATVLIKLNGGLGTSMGLDRAKTLLPVRDGRTFARATSLTVRGDVRFRETVSVVGAGLIDTSVPITIPEGTTIGDAGV